MENEQQNANEVRPDIPAPPARIAKLPVDRRGYPVPWFVHWENGTPDFRVIAAGKRQRAVSEKLCWICGDPLGKYLAFVIGPMCAINRVSAEPPGHRECAEYSARVCPFLSRPKVERREGNYPASVGLDPKLSDNSPGFACDRNPGVALVWVTREYKIFHVHNGSLLRVGDPTELLFFAHGRPAELAEVLESIRTGLPILQEAASKEGPGAVANLGAQTYSALQLIGRAYSLSATRRAMRVTT
jgi:hypothetical protein